MKDLKWRTEKRKINSLVPYSKNPRTLSEKQAADIRKSLEKFNLVEIPALNMDNTIIAGHQRLKVMQLLGRGGELIDVRVPNRKLTEKEVQEYNIRSNRNTGSWDFDMIANEFNLKELIDWGFESSDFGFEETNSDVKTVSFLLTKEQERKVRIAIEKAKKALKGSGDQRVNNSLAIVLMCDFYITTAKTTDKNK